MRKELEDLQAELAEFEHSPRQNRSNEVSMSLLLKKFPKIILRIEPDNHKLPHIHITYGKLYHAASYSIFNGEKIVGDLDTKNHKTIKQWVLKNQDKLYQIWNELISGNLEKYELLIEEIKKS